MRVISRVVVFGAVLAMGGCPKGGGETSESQGSTSAGTLETGGTTTASDPTATSETSTTGAPTTGAPTTGTPTTGDGSTGDGSTGSDPTGTPSSGGVDVLFVVDNSGSMAQEQGRLAAAAASLVDALAGRDVRIAFTTTDVGNPRCPAAVYTPEAGRFVRSSCVDRVGLGEFAFNGEDFASACTDWCALNDAALPITPTATAADPTKQARPWIESIGGVTNLPGGVSLAQAFQCFAPQGVAGCGFESPLQAMRLAIGRMQMPGEPEYGFLRDDADLLVVIVTDEMDCSASMLGAEIFTTNKVFWNDPNDPAPTSGLCWRAGVQCVGDGPTYASCAAANKGLDGMASDEAGAVLRPVTEYGALLAEVQASKSGGGSVYLRAIAGVPPGFERGVPLVFEDSVDPEFQANFGVGPACVAQGGVTQAVPALRILDAAQLLGAPTFYSVCEADYGPALAAIAGP